MQNGENRRTVDAARMPERYPPDFADVLSAAGDPRKAKKIKKKFIYVYIYIYQGMEETEKMKRGLS